MHRKKDSDSGERERAPTLLKLIAIMYVHPSTSDRQTEHARTLFEFCSFLKISWFCSCLFLVQYIYRTQQESDRQTRLERHRQQDRDKFARETPDVRNRTRSLSLLFVCVAQLSCLSTVKVCDLAAVPSAGSYTVCH